jgi:hypothetical protein
VAPVMGDVGERGGIDPSRQAHPGSIAVIDTSSSAA